MKLITLNLWGGKIYDPLMELIENNKEQADIFCFQEVYDSPRSVRTHENYSDLLTRIAGVLPHFTFYYFPMSEGYDDNGKVNFPISIGQAIFTKNDLKVKDKGVEFVYLSANSPVQLLSNGKGIFPRNFLYQVLEKDGKEFLVINLHGYWEPAPKFDTPQRFRQSEIILDLIKKKNLPTVLAGDFNLSMNTRSVLMIEEVMKNLVKDFGLKTTRSKLYNPYYRISDPFADYVFVNDAIQVKDFRALSDEVSDHLALYLEFEV